MKQLLELSQTQASVQLGKYFTAEEMAETLKTKQTMAGLQVEDRPEYKYACNGATYTGQWLGGMRHGIGTMLYPDGTRYKGNWAFNMPTHEGKLQLSNGDCYEGGWAMGQFCGYGVLK